MDARPENLTEPWMRGPMEGVDPLLAPLLYSFQMAREDLDRFTAELSPAQLWARPYGFAPVGFHIRHIAGSADRLMTYLKGDELSPAQLAELQAEEGSGQPSHAELMASLDRVFREGEALVRALDPAILREARTVGRKRLPTTVIGLLTHTAEHTQRHVGQAIAASKLAVALS
ncbi:MAG: DinB family protein [Candidatus Solibacter sp.]